MVTTGVAADEVAASTRAVDGVNGKVEMFGGSYAVKGVYGATGSVAAPLAEQFGVQFDAGAGSFANSAIGDVGGHLFWRDPSQGLVGISGDFTDWDRYGGVHVGHVGVEAEAYLSRWSVGGVVGVETGNNSSAVSLASTTVGIPGGTMTTTTSLAGLGTVTRFFDRLALSNYLTDNWEASIGHAYMGGKNQLTLGTEYGMPAGHGMMASLFAEARAGQGTDNYGAWVGVRFYFGNNDKSLIRRQREDDPPSEFTADTLFTIASTLGTSSKATTGHCIGGEIFTAGHC